MKVSVVICTYAGELFEHLQEALESVRSQTYDDIEIIVVVDGNDALCQCVRETYEDVSELIVHCNDENVGLSQSRNNAISRAGGDVIAFLDDDAIADERWIEELVETYETHDAIAVGGQMAPIWVDEKPSFLPEEFYWLVGVTHPSFAEAGEEVRNTFGSNISFCADVLEELGGFESEVGRKGELNLQAEEPLLGARMRKAYGRGVVYNPGARVAHKVFDYRTDPMWLLERSFWQGYSKHVLGRLVPEASGENESAYLRELLLEFVPSRIRELVGSPSKDKALQLGAIFMFTAVVGFGYVYGVVRSAVEN